MRDRIKDLLIVSGVLPDEADKAAGEIMDMTAEVMRQDRLVKSYFDCAVCQRRIDVVMESGPSNTCEVRSKCPQCGTINRVTFTRRFDKLIQPMLKDGEPNGRLF